MSHGVTDLQELPVRRLEHVPSLLRLLIPALLVIGIIAIAASFMGDADRAWRAYLFNWLYFTTIAQGAVTLAAVVSITRGLWSRPVRRIALGFVAFMPVALLLMIPILAIGADHIFPWIEHPVVKKQAYLNVPFMSARLIVLLGALIAIDLAFAYWSLRPDLGRLQDKVPPKLKGLYGRFTGGWRGQEAEEVRSFQKLAVLGPLMALAWAVAFGVLAWDFVMSLEPHWFSTMIGPYFFMAGFLGGIAATTTVCALHVLKGNQGDVLESSTFHDLGKLTFGFCVFWAYLFYSQFIVIWYGMLPIEQEWLIHRLGPTYRPVMITVFFSLFVLPFFGLLSATPKKRPHVLIVFTTIVLVGLWIERYLLVYPSLYIEPADGNVPLGWQEIGTGLGFLGIFLACIMWFATRFPLFQIWQPLSEVELMGVPVPDDLATPVR